jgi:hypothetical protein
MNRSKYRAAKVLTGNPPQEVSVKPLAVILYEVTSGETLKVIIHKEPFGEAICLSDYQSGQELTRCLPSMPPLVTFMGPIPSGTNRGYWIEVAKDFLEAYLSNLPRGSWEAKLYVMRQGPVLNGGSK